MYLQLIELCISLIQFYNTYCNEPNKKNVNTYSFIRI